MTEEEIEAGARSDPDNPPWSEEELARALLVLPFEQGKERVTMYLDKDVLRYFRRQGRGYQSRINAVLRAYVGSQERR